MIVIDTNVVVALINPVDPLNRRVLSDLPGLRRREFYVTTSILSEAAFFLTRPDQRRRLFEVIVDLHIQALTVDERQLWSDIGKWMNHYADHSPDWVDAHIAVLCGYDARLHVWTYDREFATIWRRPDGSAIPLAATVA